MCALSWGLKTVAFWCSVRHHSTEKCTIGTSTNAMSAAIALRFALPIGSSLGMRAQREVAEVEEEEDGRRDEPGVPRPPDAPDRPAPQRAQHERERGEQHPELGGRAGEAVPDHRAGPGPEEQGGRERRDPERQVGEPRRGDVEVHEPLRFLLGRVRGRTPEAEQPEHRQRDERGPPEHAESLGSSRRSPVLMSPPTVVRRPARRSRCRALRRCPATRPTATRLPVPLRDHPRRPGSPRA